MYRCEVTGVVSKPKEPQYRVAVEVRPVTYTNWKWDELKRDWIEVTSFGTEIVRELAVSAAGKAQLDIATQGGNDLHTNSVKMEGSHEANR